MEKLTSALQITTGIVFAALMMACFVKSLPLWIEVQFALMG